MLRFGNAFRQVIQQMGWDRIVMQANRSYIHAESGGTEGFPEYVLIPGHWFFRTELVQERTVNSVIVLVAAKTSDYSVQILDGKSGLLQ